MIRVALLMSALATGQVELRTGGVIDDPVTDATIEGVRVGGEAPRVIGWDQVRRVTGDASRLAKQYERISEQAWRARVRLARGDAGLAEPVFEKLYERYREVDGPTAALVVEGLLRCRLRRGAIAQSVDPWLDLLEERRQGDAQAGERFRPGVVDPETGLAPALSPLWIPGASVEAFAEAPPATRRDAASEALERLYRHLARRSLGSLEATPEVADDAALDPGVRFVRQIAIALSTDAAARAGGRRVLLAQIGQGLAEWQEAWARVSLGRSLLMEEDRALRSDGLLHLVHVPARFGARQPYLSGLALAEISAELAARGDDAGAETMRDELLSYGREHPAMIWLESQSETTTTIGMRREGR